MTAQIVADSQNPDRWTLLASLAVDGDGSDILFVLEGKSAVRVDIHQIQREDGYGYNFKVVGHDVFTHRLVQIYYNTNRRDGHIIFSDLS